MSTPLDVRNRRREAQRIVRIGLNLIQKSLDSWKAAVMAGKKQATDLTNALLVAEHLTALPLGCLSQMPGLRQCALKKAIMEASVHMNDLVGSLQILEESCAALADAAASLRAVAELEQGDGLLRKGPVFAALPLYAIDSIMQRIAEEHAAELRVKSIVVADLQEQISDADQSANANYGHLLIDRDSTLTDSHDKMKVEKLENFIQVHITAWVLSTQVDEQRMAADLASIVADAASC